MVKLAGQKKFKVIGILHTATLAAVRAIVRAAEGSIVCDSWHVGGENGCSNFYAWLPHKAAGELATQLMDQKLTHKKFRVREVKDEAAAAEASGDGRKAGDSTIVRVQVAGLTRKLATPAVEEELVRYIVGRVWLKAERSVQWVAYFGKTGILDVQVDLGPGHAATAQQHCNLDTPLFDAEPLVLQEAKARCPTVHLFSYQLSADKRVYQGARTRCLPVQDATYPVQAQPFATYSVQEQPPATYPIQAQPPATYPVQAQPSARLPVQAQPGSSLPAPVGILLGFVHNPYAQCTVPAFPAATATNHYAEPYDGPLGIDDVEAPLGIDDVEAPLDIDDVEAHR